MSLINKMNVGNTNYDIQDRLMPEAIGQAGQVLKVKDDGSGLEFSTIESGGGKLYQHDLTIRINTDDTLKGVIIGKIINTDSAAINTFTNTMLKKTMFDMRIYKGDPIRDRNNIYLTDRYVNDASYINTSGSVSIYGYSAGTSTYPFSDNLEEIISGTSFTVVDTVTEL